MGLNGLNPSPFFSTDPPLLSNGDCLGECSEKEVQGSSNVSQTFLFEDNGQVHPERSPLKEQVCGMKRIRLNETVNSLIGSSSHPGSLFIIAVFIFCLMLPQG